MRRCTLQARRSLHSFRERFAIAFNSSFLVFADQLSGASRELFSPKPGVTADAVDFST